MVKTAKKNKSTPCEICQTMISKSNANDIHKCPHCDVTVHSCCARNECLFSPDGEYYCINHLDRAPSITSSGQISLDNTEINAHSSLNTQSTSVVPSFKYCNAQVLNEEFFYCRYCKEYYHNSCVKSEERLNQIDDYWSCSSCLNQWARYVCLLDYSGDDEEIIREKEIVRLIALTNPKDLKFPNLFTDERAHYGNEINSNVKKICKNESSKERNSNLGAILKESMQQMFIQQQEKMLHMIQEKLKQIESNKEESEGQNETAKAQSAHSNSILEVENVEELKSHASIEYVASKYEINENLIVDQSQKSDSLSSDKSAVYENQNFENQNLNHDDDLKESSKGSEGKEKLFKTSVKKSRVVPIKDSKSITEDIYVIKSNDDGFSEAKAHDSAKNVNLSKSPCSSIKSHLSKSPKLTKKSTTNDSKRELVRKKDRESENESERMQDLGMKLAKVRLVESKKNILSYNDLNIHEYDEDELQERVIRLEYSMPYESDQQFTNDVVQYTPKSLYMSLTNDLDDQRKCQKEKKKKNDERKMGKTLPKEIIVTPNKYELLVNESLNQAIKRLHMKVRYNSSYNDCNKFAINSKKLRRKKFGRNSKCNKHYRPIFVSIPKGKRLKFLWNVIARVKERYIFKGKNSFRSPEPNLKRDLEEITIMPGEYKPWRINNLL